MCNDQLQVFQKSTLNESQEKSFKTIVYAKSITLLDEAFYTNIKSSKIIQHDLLVCTATENISGYILNLEIYSGAGKTIFTHLEPYLYQNYYVYKKVFTIM